ncbi:hypothetical protein BJX65DRAFT_170650 [Aspergillus insuetus]
MFHSQAMIVEIFAPDQRFRKILTIRAGNLAVDGCKESTRRVFSTVQRNLRSKLHDSQSFQISGQWWDVGPACSTFPEANNVATRWGIGRIQRINLGYLAAWNLICVHPPGPLAQMLHRSSLRQPITRSLRGKCSTKSINGKSKIGSKQCSLQRTFAPLQPRSWGPPSRSSTGISITNNGDTSADGRALNYLSYTSRLAGAHFISAFLSIRCYVAPLGSHCWTSSQPPTASAFLSNFQNIVSFSCGGGVWSYDPSFESLLQSLSDSASYDVFFFCPRPAPPLPRPPCLHLSCRVIETSKLTFDYDDRLEPSCLLATLGFAPGALPLLT